MESKRNQLARGQGNCDFKSNKDVHTKQFPKQQRRRESDSNQKQQPNKSRNNSNNNNFYYDKRPQPRKGGQVEQPGAGGSTGLMEADELNSVFNHGSKKQNLNHLLNFHYYSAKETEDVRGGTFTKHGYHKSYSKRYNFNKEQYLQANCQFVVKADTMYDYRPFTNSPDILVDWDQVVKVLVSSSEEAQCPICLYPPKAAKMTKCGHIFCYSCVLHYLSLSDKAWRKCPICYESVYPADLKSTTSKHNHQLYKVGDIISMELMRREKGSLYVVKAEESGTATPTGFPWLNSHANEQQMTYSKLVMANDDAIMKIIEQELNELEFQLIEDGLDCPESIFIQQAMEILKDKKNEILKKVKKEEPDSHEVESYLSSSVVKQESVEEPTENRHERIGEESSLTLNDIDIVPAVPSKYFFYYQAPNAQNVFLHSINSRMLQETYGSLNKSPYTIQGKIVQIECCTMNEDLRKRLKYLQHLPVSSVFEVVEIEFDYALVPPHVMHMFKDELLHRKKIRQKRERDERKHEKAINEINDRQMGKIMRTASANINISSNLQFPEYGSFAEMPALPSSSSDLSVSPALSNSSAGPSFANMLTAKSRKSETAWPSLSHSQGPTTSSFFGDKKLIHATGNKIMMATPQPTAQDDDEDSVGADEELKVPVYKNQLGDCLASALAKSVVLPKDSSNKGAKKKKNKKTLLFASGMNFN